MKKGVKIYKTALPKIDNLNLSMLIYWKYKIL